MAMNEYIASLYGTNKTAAAAAPVLSDEDQEKQASVELFMKIASTEGIELETMSDADVQTLYGEFLKAAEEEKKKEPAFEASDEKEEEEKKEEEKKHAEAQSFFALKKEAAAKLAEADYTGRVIAHAFVQELGNIQKEAGAKETAQAVGAVLTGKAKHVGLHNLADKAKGVAHAGADKAKELGKGYAGVAKGEGVAAARKAHHDAGSHGFGEAGKKLYGDTKDTGRSLVKEHAKRVGAIAAPAAAVAGGAAAGAAAAHHHSKHAGAFDAVAGEAAVAFAAEQGWDPEQADRKVASILELGLLGESEKVAAADDYETSVGVRALEILEAAGYPVTWES